MLSLVTVSPVITAFHSCCLSHHIFDQVNFWPAWVGIETAIFWQCSPGTVVTQRLYPLRHGPRRAIKEGFFGRINPYLVFQSRVRTEFLYIVLNWNNFVMRLLNLRINFFIYCVLLRSKTWCDRQQLWKAVITGDTVTRLSISIRGRGKITWRRPEVKFGWNVVKEETTQKNYQGEDKKSAINKKINSQIKKPHLKMIQLKTIIYIYIYIIVLAEGVSVDSTYDVVSTCY